MIHIIGALACATVICASLGAKIKRLYRLASRVKKDDSTEVKALVNVYKRQAKK